MLQLIFRFNELQQRDRQTIEQIQKIIKAQMPREQKQALADDIVVNDGHLGTFIRTSKTFALKVFGLLQTLKKKQSN